VFASPARANELWVAPTRNPAAKLIADFAVAQKNAHFGFGVPDNFNGFTRATVLLIGSRDQRIRYDLTLSISQHLASGTASVTVMKDIPAMVFQNQLLELDVSAIFNGAPALQPGRDYVSLSIDVSDARAEHDREREGEDERAEESSNDTGNPHAFLFGLRFQYAGPSGPAGPQGPKGDTGPQGLTGPAGRQGAVGPTGATGPQGRTGAAGPQGLIGLAGPQGPMGLTGRTGPQGPAGATGVQGLTGATGLTGANGEPGPSGPAGAKGLNARGAWSAGVSYFLDDVVTNEAQTWRCSVKTCGVEIPPTAKDPDWELLAAKGADGANGGQGPQGPSGPKGLNARGAWKGTLAYSLDDVVTGDGRTWRCSVATCPVEDPPKEPDWELLAAQGADGAVGAPGPQGPVGPRGPSGFNGGPGPTGPTGPSGAAGAAGPQGPQGATGSQGPQGAVGPQGPPASSGLFQLQQTVTVPAPGSTAEHLTCPAGFPFVISGGAYVVSPPYSTLTPPGSVLESSPFGLFQWYLYLVNNTGPFGFDVTFSLRVVCSR
jgi:hypothetical protein